MSPRRRCPHRGRLAVDANRGLAVRQAPDHTRRRRDLRTSPAFLSTTLWLLRDPDLIEIDSLIVVGPVDMWTTARAPEMARGHTWGTAVGNWWTDRQDLAAHGASYPQIPSTCPQDIHRSKRVLEAALAWRAPALRPDRPAKNVREPRARARRARARATNFERIWPVATGEVSPCRSGRMWANFPIRPTSRTFLFPKDYP